MIGISIIEAALRRVTLRSALLYPNRTKENGRMNKILRAKERSGIKEA